MGPTVTKPSPSLPHPLVPSDYNSRQARLGAEPLREMGVQFTFTGTLKLRDTCASMKERNTFGDPGEKPPVCHGVLPGLV